MSRFAITNNKGQKFVYGYDRPLQYYFLDKETKDPMQPRALVGLLSEVYGSASNLYEMCKRVGINLPEIHREDLAMDLPLRELPEPAEPLTGPEYGDPDPDDSLIEDPQSFHSSIDQWGVG
jgi:hypothetical protein